jgi:glycogen phosphorylase
LTKRSSTAGRRSAPTSGCASATPGEIARPEWAKEVKLGGYGERHTDAAGRSRVALTIGTLDGANIEIRDEVGEQNFFTFGLSTPEVAALNARGYCPMQFLDSRPELREVIELLRNGFFSRGDTQLFRPLIDALLNSDPYMVLADYASYAECQERVGRAFNDAEAWSRMSILNAVRSGKFSSDRSVREYCADIWHVNPERIRLLTPKEVKAGSLQ